MHELCYVARDADGILGVLFGLAGSCWRPPSLALGPIAVHPTRQSEGLGNALISHALAQSKRLDWPRVLLVGDAPYYGRFGFDQLATVQMPPPTNPERVLGWGDWIGISGMVEKASP